MAEPAYWLVKSEPAKYSFQDLERDGRTIWDGVRNNQAAIWLREMKVGDLAFYYHSQEGLAVVGIARVSREWFPDPTDPSGRFVAVEFEPVRPVQDAGHARRDQGDAGAGRHDGCCASSASR